MRPTQSSVRPEEMTSSGSARLKAKRSATCWPCGSTTVSFWPLFRVNATPERGGISCRARSLAPGMKGADPSMVDGASAVLASLGRLPMGRQHRIDRPRKPEIPLDDPVPKFVVASIRPKLLELVVQVEDERPRLEAARLSAGVRVQADDEESLAAEGEREMRIVRVSLHALVIGQSQPRILAGERLHPRPEMALEVRLGQDCGHLEDNGKAPEQAGRALVPAHKRQEGRIA